MTTTQNAIWIVCHRHFDHGSAGLYAFSMEEKAYLHAARLILKELDVLVRLDDETGPRLVQALRDERYEDAVRLYHGIDGNNDAIDVVYQEIDQFHKDQPVEVPAFGD